MNKNILIQGDNLDAMHWLIANGYKGKIDLVYIDPPFATGGVFAVDADGRVATISKSADSEIAYEDTLLSHNDRFYSQYADIMIHYPIITRK